MNKKLYMIVELKTDELIEVYQITKDKNEQFEANNVIYNSLTEFFVDHIDYQFPMVDTFVKNIELCDIKNEVQVTLSQKRALGNYKVCVTNKDTDFEKFLKWAKECEENERY